VWPASTAAHKPDVSTVIPVITATTAGLMSVLRAG
jgi:hypothetical protein